MKHIGGFTIIEMFIALIICGIFAAAIVPQILNLTQQQTIPITADVYTKILSSDIVFDSPNVDGANVIHTEAGVFVNTAYVGGSLNDPMVIKSIVDDNINNQCLITFMPMSNPSYRHITHIECDPIGVNTY